MNRLYAAAIRLREAGDRYASIKYDSSLDEARAAHPLSLSSAAEQAARKHDISSLKDAERAYRNVSVMFDTARSNATWKETKEAWLLCPESDTFLRPKIWDGDAQQLDAYIKLYDVM